MKWRPQGGPVLGGPVEVSGRGMPSPEVREARRAPPVNLASVVSRVVAEELGMPDDRAQRIGQSVQRRLRSEYGGTRLYISAHSPRVDRAALLAEFDGRNHEILCRRYGITRRRLRQILAEARRQRRRE